jgi:hypothetical protein
LADVSKLTLDRSTFDDAQKLAIKYRAAIAEEQNVVGDTALGCTPEHCEFKFFFHNNWLRRLRLAPPVWLRAGIGVSRGRIAYRHVELCSGEGAAYYSAYVTEVPNLPQPLKDYNVGRQWSSDIKWRVSIEMTPAATAQEHGQAYRFNVRCLSRLGGCKDASELLPSIKWDSPRDAPKPVPK